MGTIQADHLLELMGQTIYENGRNRPFMGQILE